MALKLIVFRQIAALDAEDEKKIIESIEKEFENQAAALPVDDVSEKTSPEDVVNEKLNRLNLMFENENVSNYEHFVIINLVFIFCC